MLFFLQYLETIQRRADGALELAQIAAGLLLGGIENVCKSINLHLLIYPGTRPKCSSGHTPHLNSWTLKISRKRRVAHTDSSNANRLLRLIFIVIFFPFFYFISVFLLYADFETVSKSDQLFYG